jgi:hypothetical protein
MLRSSLLFSPLCHASVSRLRKVRSGPNRSVRAFRSRRLSSFSTTVNYRQLCMESSYETPRLSDSATTQDPPLSTSREDGREEDGFRRREAGGSVSVRTWSDRQRDAHRTDVKHVSSVRLPSLLVPVLATQAALGSRSSSAIPDFLPSFVCACSLYPG